ncbi:P63C domain-containing protein [Alloalcanivorax xenomutans]|uniref:P63C domain-containing protein n=1 Tax=Alloalcanivorax xenomutans TaxID=1094342 RepID=UPI003BA8874D
MSDESGRSKGGKARAAALSPLERSAIAKRAAEARWGTLPKATHKGNFYDDFGINVDCYVLDDESKTAVISQTGMGEAIGLSARGSAFPRFMKNRVMSEYVGAELAERIQKPLKFQWGSGGAEMSKSAYHGYDVTLLIDVCKAIIRADQDGRLSARQQPVARQASIIIHASAKSGIQNLVYKLAGYDATKQEAISAFKLFVREEAREYEREFPEELYDQWYRLYALPRPERNRPWKFKHLTEKQVYQPLARSNGRIWALTKESRRQSGKKGGKLHQFLSEVGVKALRVHLGKLTGIASISSDAAEYEQHFNRLFGDQRDFFDQEK